LSSAAEEPGRTTVSESVRELREAILEMIRGGLDQPPNDAAFNELALRVFAYQFEANASYRKFCQRRGRDPETVRGWQQVPPVPIAAFKELTLACGPVEESVACFMTSGTTNPEMRGKHYHFTLEVYNASATTFFKTNVLPDVDRMRLFILGSPPDLSPNSSLSHYLGLMHRHFGSPGSRFYIGAEGLKTDDLVSDLRGVERSGEPACLLGASFAFVHFLDCCRADGLRLRLASGSRIMDTGGFKGQSRELPQAELYAAFAEFLAVPAERCVNMYGMTELSMQCYDSPLRRRVLGLPEERLMQAPPWARSVVLNADSLGLLAPGMRGILCHFDLANCSSVIGILTEDVGVATPAGFRLLGRVKGAESRGCSVSVDEMLAAAGKRSA
jgi:acyl-protein synthetase LuxE